MAELTFDDDSATEETEASGLIGEKVTSYKRHERHDYRHLTPFAILAFLTFAFFVAILVFQALEIKFFQDAGMWPS